MSIIFSLFWNSFTLIDISRCSGSFSVQRMHWHASVFSYQQLFSDCLECWNVAGLKIQSSSSFPSSSPFAPSLILFVFPLGELLCSKLHILFDNDPCPKKGLMLVCIGIGNSAWIQGISDELHQLQSCLKSYLKSIIFHELHTFCSPAFS